MRRHGPEVLLILFLFFLGSCSRPPSHASYIPRDAVAVASVNMKGLGKKIAWNLITGSKLYKEMQARIPENSTKDAMSKIENAGIDLLNTVYVYVKTDTRFKGGNRITGLVPLSDAAGWENFVRQVFPKVSITEANGIKEASLGSDMYVGWNSNLLVIINDLAVNGDDDNGRPAYSISSKMDTNELSGEMAAAFGVTKDNSLLTVPRFMELQHEDHDLAFWLNYEQITTDYGSDMANMLGVSLSGSVSRNSALAVGFDFQKGKIAGDMTYYLPDSMVDEGRELAATNINADMLSRMPTHNLDLLLAMHISPQALKASLIKLGFYRVASSAMDNIGLSIDSTLATFTGDMALLINDFSVKTVKQKEMFYGQVTETESQKPALSLSYFIKLNNKTYFNKLLGKLVQGNLLKFRDGYVQPIDESDSAYILADEQYAVISTKLPYVDGFMRGDYQKDEKPACFTNGLMTAPMGVYVDMLTMFHNIDLPTGQDPYDSAVYAASSNLLNNISFSGGKFSGNSLKYHLDVNFVNTDENSFIQLMDYGEKINEAGNHKN